MVLHQLNAKGTRLPQCHYGPFEVLCCVSINVGHTLPDTASLSIDCKQCFKKMLVLSGLYFVNVADNGTRHISCCCSKNIHPSYFWGFCQPIYVPSCQPLINGDKELPADKALNSKHRKSWHCPKQCLRLFSKLEQWTNILLTIPTVGCWSPKRSEWINAALTQSSKFLEVHVRRHKGLYEGVHGRLCEAMVSIWHKLHKLAITPEMAPCPFSPYIMLSVERWNILCH